MADREALTDLTQALRTFMPAIWHTWHAADGRQPPSPLSAGTCGRTSLLLTKILLAEGRNAAWRTGAASQARGFFDGRRWRSHSWVECEGFILDITADQFGAPPVLVVGDDDRRYRASEADPALPDRQERRERAAAAALALWRQAHGG